MFAIFLFLFFLAEAIFITTFQLDRELCVRVGNLVVLKVLVRLCVYSIDHSPKHGVVREGYVVLLDYHISHTGHRECSSIRLQATFSLPFVFQHELILAALDQISLIVCVSHSCIKSIRGFATSSLGFWTSFVKLNQCCSRYPCLNWNVMNYLLISVYDHLNASLIIRMFQKLNHNESLKHFSKCDLKWMVH